MYRDMSLFVANLNRCLADKMSRAVDLVVKHGMGGNVDKRLDDWLDRCGERL